MPTTCLGVNSLRFMFGSRSVPPASSMAAGPRSCSSRWASASVAGRWYLKMGSLSNLRSPHPSPFPLGRGDLLAQRFQDVGGGNGYLVEADADGVVDGVGEGGWEGVERTFAGFFGAVGALGIVCLDQNYLDLGRLQEGRNLVIQQRGLLVQAATEDLLLAQALGQAHVDAAFDLCLSVGVVQGLAKVVRGPGFIDLDLASLGIDVQFHDPGGVAVGGSDADGAAAVIGCVVRRRVAAGGAQRAVLALGLLRRLVEVHVMVGLVDLEDAPPAGGQSLLGYLQKFGC